MHHHRHFALFFIPLLCFALVVGSAHGSPFPRCKKASSRCVGFVVGFIVGFYVMIYAAWCLCDPELSTRDASATLDFHTGASAPTASSKCASTSVSGGRQSHTQTMP
jgi:hydrogenase/urease accessory protein HupE